LRGPGKPGISPRLGGALNFAVLAFQNVPPAPGRAETTAPAQPAEKGHARGGESAPPGGGLTSMLMPLLLVGMLIFIFWSSRSQTKKQEQAITSLKKGDRVVTQAGIVGRLVDIDPRYAKIEVAPGVKLQVLRTSLSGRDADETPQKKEKDEPSSEIKKT
jgi:preprotein translocase subunit YajC